MNLKLTPSNVLLLIAAVIVAGLLVSIFLVPYITMAG